MFADPQREPLKGFRNPLLYTSVLLGIAVLYVGWVFFSRWQENREMERKAAEEKRAEDKSVVEMLGGNRFAILNFYASPGEVRRGETAQLCYGVANAKTVRLEPQTSPVWPSYNHCVDVAPTKDTTYTLTAEDAAGHIQTATVAVKVRLAGGKAP
jgi:hypothetical protein